MAVRLAPVTSSGTHSGQRRGGDNPARPERGLVLFIRGLPVADLAGLFSDQREAGPATGGEDRLVLAVQRVTGLLALAVQVLHIPVLHHRRAMAHLRALYDEW